MLYVYKCRISYTSSYISPITIGILLVVFKENIKIVAAAGRACVRFQSHGPIWMHLRQVFIHGTTQAGENVCMQERMYICMNV